MRNKYLLLGVASAMMLAACSEDIKGPESNNKPVENALNLTSLSPASQAGRVSLPGQTRGQKADRLQLVAKIAPVDYAAEKNWSATGVTFAGGNAFVSWHSNHQAKVPAEAWGGAIDMIDINALIAKDGDVITNTFVSQSSKFNNIVAHGSNLYLPITCYKNGAIVGRWTRGALTMDTIGVPGSSANAIAFEGDNLYVASGYAGGVYTVPAAFDRKEEASRPVSVVDYSASFGGKYIDGGYVLRTDDEKSEIINLSTKTVRNTGAPLKSTLKNAEDYDGNSWNVVQGKDAEHYGKHTMAVSGPYIYVGGGKGDLAQNGLRVYDESGIVWENGTNTTAVCVAGDYVYAATGAGLRVYEKFNGTDLPLFAFEVLNYDENGNAADVEGTNKPAAGTTAHSSNFVAVDPGSGLIFVACGQSGVYVFKLNPAGTAKTGFTTPYGDYTEEDVDAKKKFEVPAAPADSDEDFVWVDEEGNEYTPGDEVELEPGTVIALTEGTKSYKYILHFDGNSPETGKEVTGVPADKKSNDAMIAVPNAAPVCDGYVFKGWSADKNASPIHEVDTFTQPGGSYTCAAEGETTLYAIWALKTSADAEEGNGNTPDPEPEPDDNNQSETPDVPGSGEE